MFIGQKTWNLRLYLVNILLLWLLKNWRYVVLNFFKHYFFYRFYVVFKNQLVSKAVHGMKMEFLFTPLQIT